MTKVLLDSNIVIAIGKGHLPISAFEGKSIEISEMTRLEVYGYHRLYNEEEREFNRFFQHIRSHSISKEIIDQAIIYRRTKKISVGDAIRIPTRNTTLYRQHG